jgi:RNA polymerase sigma factor (sigma-70 family)
MVEPSSHRQDLVEDPFATPGDDPHEQADETLLRLYRDRRDTEAFAEIVRRHQPMIFRTCLRLLGNVQDAEDTTQSVFLVLAQRPEVVRRSLAGCLHELARAAVSELCRSRRRRSQREEMAARLHSLFTRLRGGFQPMEHEELREELDLALAQLPDSLRQAVILRYLEGHSQQEAARYAGCTQVTIGWRSMKGLERLRQILDRRGVVLASPALLALLETEARAAAALSLSSAVSGSATATAAHLTAVLLKQSQVSSILRKVLVVATLATASLALGAGIALVQNSREDTPPKPRSPQAVQTPAAPAPKPVLGLFDKNLDIGGPTHRGAAQFEQPRYTVQGGGRHIFGDADQFRFVCRPGRGDGEITACVSIDPNQRAKDVAAGVMFRESLDADSRHVAVLVSAGRRYDIKYRLVAGRPTRCHLQDADPPGKQWVRLVRRGNVFTAFVRPEGAPEWNRLGEVKLELNALLFVGLAVTAHNDDRLATATFEHVAVR